MRPRNAWRPKPARPSPASLVQVVLFVALLLYPLGIPTSWTRAHIEQMRAEDGGGTA
jgi:hypothetical protein